MFVFFLSDPGNIDFKSYRNINMSMSNELPSCKKNTNKQTNINLKKTNMNKHSEQK